MSGLRGQMTSWWQAVMKRDIDGWGRQLCDWRIKAYRSRRRALRRQGQRRGLLPMRSGR